MSCCWLVLPCGSDEVQETTLTAGGYRKTNNVQLVSKVNDVQPTNELSTTMYQHKYITCEITYNVCKTMAQEE